MGNGLSEPDIGKGCLDRWFVQEKVQKPDPHGFRFDDGEIRHLFQFFGLIYRDPPDPVQTAGHELGDLGADLRDGPLFDGSYTRLSLGAVLEIVFVFHHGDRLARNHLDHLVRTGSNGFDPKLLHADFEVVILRIDGDRSGEILKGGRKRLLQVDPNFIGPQLFRVFYPVEVAHDLHLVRRVSHVIDGPNHVVGIKFLPVVESDPLTQLQLDHQIIDPLEVFGQASLVFAAVRIPVEQRIVDVKG